MPETIYKLELPSHMMCCALMALCAQMEGCTTKDAYDKTWRTAMAMAKPYSPEWVRCINSYKPRNVPETPKKGS